MTDIVTRAWNAVWHPEDHTKAQVIGVLSALLAEVERFQAKASQQQRVAIEFATERDHWKALWRQDQETAKAALAERDKANADVEQLRAAIERWRASESEWKARAARLADTITRHQAAIARVEKLADEVASGDRDLLLLADLRTALNPEGTQDNE